MESIIIYPENKKQLSLLKSLLEEMKVRFKTEEDFVELESWEKALIDKGLHDIKEGKTVAQKEVQNKAREICSK